MKKLFSITSLAFLLSTNLYAGELKPIATSNDALLNVHNRCIVRLHNDIDAEQVSGIARATAAQNNASLQHIYKHSIKGFAINMPCSAAEKAFADDIDVFSLEPDSIVSINRGKPSKGDNDGDAEKPPQQVSYGTTMVGGGVDGTGYTAWVIDTGIDLEHADLNVDKDSGFSAFLNRKTGAQEMGDQNGHGTHVAGTIAAIDNTIGSLGVAQGATVVPVRVLDRRGSGTISGVIAGVDHVAANAQEGDCANMSLGGGASQSLDIAVSAAASKGILFAVAAGNDGRDASYYSPARVNAPYVWTISAVDSTGKMPSWSNYGLPVDYAAPGVGIYSLWKDGDTNTISGTSMATPHACAVLMLTSGNPSSLGVAVGDPDENDDPIISFIDY
jgi:subtilisin family serine protease